jgi:hypothetical protein
LHDTLGISSCPWQIDTYDRKHAVAVGTHLIP